MNNGCTDNEEMDTGHRSDPWPYNDLLSGTVLLCYNRRTVPALLELVAETGTEKTLLTKTSLDESAEGRAAKLCTDGRNLKHKPSGRIRFLVVFAVVDIVAHEHGSG